MDAAWVVYMRKIRNTRLPIPPAYLKTGVTYEWMAVFMLETLKLSKTLKSSRDEFNVKYNLPFLYLTLKSSRDDFNVLDNFNVSSLKTANNWRSIAE